VKADGGAGEGKRFAGGRRCQIKKFIPYKIYTYTVNLFIMIKGNEGFRHT